VRGSAVESQLHPHFYLSVLEKTMQTYQVNADSSLASATLRKEIKTVLLTRKMDWVLNLEHQAIRVELNRNSKRE